MPGLEVLPAQRLLMKTIYLGQLHAIFELSDVLSIHSYQHDYIRILLKLPWLRLSPLSSPSPHTTPAPHINISIHPSHHLIRPPRLLRLMPPLVLHIIVVLWRFLGVSARTVNGMLAVVVRL